MKALKPEIETLIKKDPKLNSELREYFGVSFYTLIRWVISANENLLSINSLQIISEFTGQKTEELLIEK